MPFHRFITDGPGWATRASETVYANAYLEVHRVSVATPSRAEPRDWTVVHRKAAVVIAPQTEDGRWVLVRQERIPVRRAMWEFPAGQIDDGGGEHDEAAIRATGVRELREESGYEPGEGAEVTSLGFFFPSAGFTDEHSHLVLIRPVAPSPRGAEHDEAESITGCRAFSADELRAMVASGEICDANSLAVYARLRALALL